MHTSDFLYSLVCSVYVVVNRVCVFVRGSELRIFYFPEKIKRKII